MTTRALTPWLLSLVLFGTGCGANAERPESGPDCKAGAGYELKDVFVNAATMNVGDGPVGYSFGDTTPGATQNFAAIAGNPALTCGHSPVLELQSQGYKDWGSTFYFVINGFGSASGKDETGTLGISFWARTASEDVGKAATLFLSDASSDGRAGEMTQSCTQPMAVDQIQNTSGGDMSGTAVQNGTTASQTPGFAYKATDCGNDFQYIVQFTDVWTLYQIPYGLMYQLQQANIEPSGINVSDLWSLYFRIPKEAHFDLWIDQLGTYRASSAAAGP